MTLLRDSIPYPKLILAELRAGQDHVDARCKFIPLSEMTFTNGNSDTWNFDNDPDHSKSMAEPRAFCYKGSVNFSFIGDCLVLRLSLSENYGVGTVSIDGVSYGNASCNSSDPLWNSDGDTIQDLTIATGLTNGTHNVSIVCDNSPTVHNGNSYFVFHGAKAYSKDNRIINIDGWNLPDAKNIYNYNSINLGIYNSNIPVTSSTPEATILPSSFNIPDTYVEPTTQDTKSNSWSLGSEKADGVTKQVAAGDIGMISAMFYGTWVKVEWLGSWGDSTLRVYIDGDPAPVPTINTDTSSGDGNNHWSVTEVASNLSPGLHTINIYGPKSGSKYGAVASIQQDPNQIPTVQENSYVQLKATSEDTVLIQGEYKELNESADSINGDESFKVDFRYPVVGTLDKGIHTTAIDLSYGLPDANGTVDVSGYKFTTVNETLTVNFNLRVIPAYPLENVRIENGVVKWDPIDYTKEDLSVPVSNKNIQGVNVYGRTAAIGCTFENTDVDVAKLYDVFYLDPSTVSRDQVAEMQNMGIKVYGYVTIGEEDGKPINPYNWDDVGPVVGDGLGPEGKASYYLSNPDGTIAGNTFWQSYYPDPSNQDWINKVLNYYLPPVLDNHTDTDTETGTLVSNSSPQGDVLGFVVQHHPIDLGFLPTGIHVSSGRPIPGLYIDSETGALYVPTDPLEVEGQPDVIPKAGDEVQVTYLRRALNCDGVLIDTIDAVDEYPSLFSSTPGKAELLTNAMADLVHSMSNKFPSKLVQTERGFTILDKIQDVVCGNFFEAIATIFDDTTNKWRMATEEERQDDAWPLLNQANQLRAKKLYDVAAITYTDNGLATDPFYDEALKFTLDLGIPSNIFRLDLDITRPPPDVHYGSGPIRTMEWRLIHVNKRK